MENANKQTNSRIDLFKSSEYKIYPNSTSSLVSSTTQAQKGGPRAYPPLPFTFSLGLIKSGIYYLKTKLTAQAILLMVNKNKVNYVTYIKAQSFIQYKLATR